MKPEMYKLGKYLLCHLPDENQAAKACLEPGAAVRIINRPASFFKKFSSGYLLVSDEAFDISCENLSLRRMLSIACDTDAGLVYSDFLETDGKDLRPHPLNDYSEGSIRDDFNFGPFFLLSAAAIQAAIEKYGAMPPDETTALYDLRLKISIDSPIQHVPEFLYAASRKKVKKAKRSAVKTEAHFAYVAKENALRQKKLEKIATGHLKRIGAHLPPRIRTTERPADDFQWKASIVIPVFNRRKTIADALKSALEQETDFAFNILVVDNFSTDGTTEILKKFTSRYPHIQHILPSRRGLGIGGCWNEAIFSPACGRYAVQLDSDDLYSSPHTLQKIVDMLRKGPYAMVVGSYTLVNEKLKTLPPGLIDHREWTQANGHNNLLRVNGMGAPRAFDTAVLRQTGFPDVSYGEDYSVALRMTREYKIGRIYESLYFCRRWSDNTDAALSVEKQNGNDFYKDRLRTLEIKARQQLCRERFQTVPYARPFPTAPGQIFADYPGQQNVSLSALCHTFFESQKQSWRTLANACRDLAGTKIREVSCGNYSTALQYNPARIVSGSAAVDPESIRKRPCFLCTPNRPVDQHAILYRNEYLILCNPAPIFDHHFTVVSAVHTPQDIASSIEALLQISRDASPGYTVFYNGPACGASAPDHLHFQMIPVGALPFLHDLSRAQKAKSVRITVPKGFDRAIIVMESAKADALKEKFLAFLKSAQTALKISGEPPVNVFCTYEKQSWRLTLFLRRKHRPDAYFADGDQRIFVSPGAIDMAGLLVLPDVKDFKRLDCDTLRGIYREVSMTDETLGKLQKGFS